MMNYTCLTLIKRIEELVSLIFSTLEKIIKLFTRNLAFIIYQHTSIITTHNYYFFDITLLLFIMHCIKYSYYITGLPLVFSKIFPGF